MYIYSFSTSNAKIQNFKEFLNHPCIKGVLKQKKTSNITQGLQLNVNNLIDGESCGNG